MMLDIGRTPWTAFGHVLLTDNVHQVVGRVVIPFVRKPRREVVLSNSAMIVIVRLARVHVEVRDDRAVGLVPLALLFNIGSVQRSPLRAQSIESDPHIGVVLLIQWKRQMRTH